MTDFTDEAHKVLAEARNEALRFDHDLLEPEHVLLAILRKKDCLAFKVIRSLRIDPRKIRLEVEKDIKAGPHLVYANAIIPQSFATYTMLYWARHGAFQEASEKMGTNHFLLGLMADATGHIAELLWGLGLRREEVIDTAKKLIREGDAESNSAAPLTPVSYSYEVGRPAWTGNFATFTQSTGSSSPLAQSPDAETVKLLIKAAKAGSVEAVKALNDWASRFKSASAT